MNRPLGWRAPESFGRPAHQGSRIDGSLLATLPRASLLPELPEVYDQGSVGSCTAQALAAAVEVLHARGGYEAERPDRAALYYRERVAIGLPGEDAGAILADGIAALRLGYEAERAASTAWGPAWTEPPPLLAANAPRVVSAEPLAPDVATVCWEIASGHPVAVGLSITDAWFDCTGELPPPAGPSVGGHAVLLVGYNLERAAFRVRNSWGAAWGEGGYAWLPFAWASLPWCGEAHALRSVRRLMESVDVGLGSEKTAMLDALDGAVRLSGGALLDGPEHLVQNHLRAAAPAPTPRPEPPRGIYLQIYRGAIRGPTREARRDQLASYCDRIAVIGLPGVVFHGFCEDLAGAWDGLAKLAHDRGLLALASWGLDSRDLSAARKGELVGDVLARSTCAAGLLDAEGQWDADLGAADDMDEAGALALSAAIRSKAPGAWVGDQPWYAIEAHGDLRKTARPMSAGGVFRGFPVDEFATVTTWGRFRQAYLYRSQGALYEPTFARMDREWSAITPALRAAGLERPLRVTLQAYGWLLHEQVHALVDRGVRRGDPVVLWCDPWPDAVALPAIGAATWLEHEGYARPGVDARAAVRAAQAELNRRGARLTVDGLWGEATHRAAGLP